MPIEDIVSIVIRRESQTVSRAGFGTVLLAGYHTHWGASEFVRTYSCSNALATMVTDGFAITDPLYLKAQALCSQNPRPVNFKIGKLSTAWTHTVKITPSAVNSTVYAGKIAGLPWTFTSDSSATLAEACTGIASAIDALAGVGATSSGTVVTVTADAAGKLIEVEKDVTAAGPYEIEDITAATNLVTELTAIRLLDDDWYGLCIDNTSTARIVAVAAYAETLQLIFLAQTNQTLCLNPGDATDIMSTLKTSNYARTGTIYHPDADSGIEAAWFAATLPYDAGGATFAFKTLAGVSTPKLSTTAQNAVAAKRGNFYVSVAGISGTRWGVTASGEYIDTTLSIDWLHARWGERLFGLLSSLPKLPYTDASVVKVKSELGAVNGIAVRQGILANDPAPTVDAPKVSAVDPTDRANRLLPDVTVTGRLAGAIHTIDVTASLAV
jgi:hypothetical protein